MILEILELFLGKDISKFNKSVFHEEIYLKINIQTCRAYYQHVSFVMEQILYFYKFTDYYTIN